MPEILLQSRNVTRHGWVNKIVETDLTSVLRMSLPFLIISFLGLLGNGLVLWYLCFGIPRNPFTVYILNLAIADISLLFAMTVIVLHIISIASGAKIPHSNEVLMFSLRVLFTSGYNTSLFLLTAISVERCLSVLYPIWYKCRRPHNLSIVVCGLLWFFAIFVTVLESFTCTDELYVARVPQCTVIVLFFMVLCFGVVSPLMILSSLALIIKVRRHSKRHQPTKLYRVILLNIMVFLVTTFPTRIVCLLFYFQVITQDAFNYSAMLYAHLFCTAMNSSANPYIYVLVGRTKKTKTSRGSFKMALRRVFRNEPEIPQQEETLRSRASKTGDGALAKVIESS